MGDFTKEESFGKKSYKKTQYSNELASKRNEHFEDDMITQNSESHFADEEKSKYEMNLKLTTNVGGPAIGNSSEKENGKYEKSSYATHNSGELAEGTISEEKYFNNEQTFDMTENFDQLTTGTFSKKEIPEDIPNVQVPQTFKGIEEGLLNDEENSEYNIKLKFSQNCEGLEVSPFTEEDYFQDENTCKLTQNFEEVPTGIFAYRENAEQKKNSKMNEFFHDLLERDINYQLSNEETNDIVHSIDILVETIVAMVTTKVAWLPFSRILKVGSISEDTSIQKPNEFDYLVVLHAGHGEIEVERVCQNRRGYVHVKVIDERLRLLWGKWMEGKYLKSDFTRANTNVGSGYFDTLGNAFRSEVENTIEQHYEDLFNTTDTGTMKVDSKSMKKHGPAFLQKFVWKSVSRKEKISIDVDITPAIELDLSPEIISDEDTYDANVFSKLKSNGKFMIISCRNNATCEERQCFLLTFTETEVELVRSLSLQHKNCYKLLKYLFNSGAGYSFLSSYVWKTLILKHSCHCQESLNLEACFKSVVASCLYYLFNRQTCEKIELSRIARVFMPGEKFVLNIPSVFFNEHNILDSKDYKFPCEQFLQEIEIMLQSLEDIRSNQSTDFEKNKRNLKIVNSHGTGAAAFALSNLSNAFVKRLPILKENTELTRCLECYQTYFNENIL